MKKKASASKSNEDERGATKKSEEIDCFKIRETETKKKDKEWSVFGNV